MAVVSGARDDFTAQAYVDPAAAAAIASLPRTKRSVLDSANAITGSIGSRIQDLVKRARKGGVSQIVAVDL